MHGSRVRWRSFVEMEYIETNQARERGRLEITAAEKARLISCWNLGNATVSITGVAILKKTEPCLKDQ